MFLRRVSIIILLFAILVLPLGTAYAISSSGTNIVDKPNISTWLWDVKEIVKDSDGVIDFLAKNNVGTLYIQINYEVKKDVYRGFIKMAAQKGISVYALDGSSDWISVGGEKAQKRFFNWLTDYQESSKVDEVFSGVHLDVEPYLNKEYKNDRNKAIEKYQEFLLYAVDECKKLNLAFGVDIPFWFDEVDYSTRFGIGTAAEWVIKNVSNVTVMAYRDTASGRNGINKLIENEMAIGEKYNSKVEIAVETGKSGEGDSITFFEEGQEYMLRQLSVVEDTYKDNSSFSGFAIHHYKSWRDLAV